MSKKERKYNRQINIMNVLAYKLMLIPDLSSVVLQRLSLVVVLFLLFVVVRSGPSRNRFDVVAWMLR